MIVTSKYHMICNICQQHLDQQPVYVHHEFPKYRQPCSPPEPVPHVHCQIWSLHMSIRDIKASSSIRYTSSYQQLYEDQYISTGYQQIETIIKQSR